MDGILFYIFVIIKEDFVNKMIFDKRFELNESSGDRLDIF